MFLLRLVPVQLRVWVGYVSACSPVAALSPLILPSSLGVRAGHLHPHPPRVVLMGSQDQNLLKAHGPSLPGELIELKPTPCLNRLSRLSFSKEPANSAQKMGWDRTPVCVSPSAAGWEFRNADVALLAFQYSFFFFFFCARLPGMVKAAAEPGGWSWGAGGLEGSVKSPVENSYVY